MTYVGKDIALQMWKYGLLDRDFYYRVFAESPAPPLWSTSSDPATAAASHPPFGRAAMVCNVIDTRQAYLQKLLKQALAALGFQEQARRSVHYSYEMVALTHNTARELGYESTEDSGKPFVEVSGRKGLGVKADDLIDRLTDKAAAEVARRNTELTSDEARRTAEMIAVAAVRYFMVKFSRGKVIAFDIDEALSFEGESGPYLQYAVVRANNIFAKLKDREGLDARGRAGRAAVLATRRDRGRQRRLTRAVGPGARGGPPRRGRRPGGSHAGTVRRREVRVRAGATVQRLLSRVPDSQGRAPRRPPVARRRGGLLPPAADDRAGPDGMRGAGEDVGAARDAESMKPVIGITRCSRVDDYVESVKRAGGEPVVLDPTDDPAGALDNIDALLLSGGLDIDPALYGEAPHPTTEVDAERDRFEIPLSREAVARDMPVFAICRGVQVLNVAAGGSLVQDIPTSVTTGLAHSIDVPKDHIAHPVRVTPGTRLAASLGAASGDMRRQQPASPGRRPRGAVVRRVRCVGGWRRGSDRTPRVHLLRRRAVASGEFLEDREFAGLFANSLRRRQARGPRLTAKTAKSRFAVNRPCTLLDDAPERRHDNPGTPRRAGCCPGGATTISARMSR